jgi:cell division protein FtsL
MKQKLTLTISSAFLLLSLSTNALALDLGAKLKKITGGATPDVAESLKGISGIDGKIQDALNNIKSETLGKVDVEIKKITQKIEAEEAKIRGMIQEVEDGVNKFRSIKAKFEKYMGMAKAVLAVLSGGLIAIAFFLWRVWRNIVGFKKIIKNVTNYDEIKNKIADLEDKLAQLDGKKVAGEVQRDTSRVRAAPKVATPQQQAPVPKAPVANPNDSNNPTA